MHYKKMIIVYYMPILVPTKQGYPRAFKDLAVFRRGTSVRTRSNNQKPEYDVCPTSCVFEMWAGRIFPSHPSRRNWNSAMVIWFINS